VNDWEEVAAYDLVYSRLLLQHVSRPVELLQRMWAAVRPQGAIIVEDADFDGLFWHPANAGFDLYARLYPRVLERRGGDAAIGRKLYGYFLEAGIPDPDLRLVQRADAVGVTKTLALSTLAATAAAIVEERLASAQEVTAALADLGTFTADATTVIGGPRVFQLWARRPLA
jgi:hypothetical protein